MAGRTVVTGGFGYIGRHTVQRLQAEGADVSVLARTTKEPAGAVPVLRADVRDLGAVNGALRTGDTIVHLACLAVGPSRANPEDDFSVNALGTFNVLEAARRVGISRVVIVSSAEVYGAPATSPMNEEHPLAPTSPYGVSKAAGDLYAGVYRSLYGVNAVVLRLFNVFGPSADGTPRRTVETIFAGNAVRGEPLVMSAHPETTRDFVFIDDVTRVLTKAAAGAGTGIYNIGSGRATTLRELALAAGYAPSDIPAATDDPPTRPVCADIARARRDLGFAPSTSVLDFVSELRAAGAPHA